MDDDKPLLLAFLTVTLHAKSSEDAPRIVNDELRLSVDSLLFVKLELSDSDEATRIVIDDGKFSYCVPLILKFEDKSAESRGVM